MKRPQVGNAGVIRMRSPSRQLTPPPIEGTADPPLQQRIQHASALSLNLGDAAHHRRAPVVGGRP
eukprot:13377333-Alexandrium_andersonii.AAC.1